MNHNNNHQYKQEQQQQQQDVRSHSPNQVDGSSSDSKSESSTVVKSSSSKLRFKQHKKSRQLHCSLKKLTRTVSGVEFGSSNRDGEDEEAVEAKRKYNRESAARARQRQKDLVSDLQAKISELYDALNNKQRENDVLKARNDVLAKQNGQLLGEHTAKQASPPRQVSLQNAQMVNFGQQHSSNNNLSAMQATPPQLQNPLAVLQLLQALQGRK